MEYSYFFTLALWIGLGAVVLLLVGAFLLGRM